MQISLLLHADWNKSAQSALLLELSIRDRQPRQKRPACGAVIGPFLKDYSCDLLLPDLDEKEDAMFCHVDDVCLPEEGIHSFLLESSCEVWIETLCRPTLLPKFLCYARCSQTTRASTSTTHPPELASTLEFLQRCFFSINPERRTRVDKKGKSRLILNPRVLTLIQERSDFEWRGV
ncbi:uncharacterized protein LOC144994367 [Oryzias latipes]